MIKVLGLVQGLFIAKVLTYLVEITRGHSWQRGFYLGVFIPGVIMGLIYGLRKMQQASQQRRCGQTS